MLHVGPAATPCCQADRQLQVCPCRTAINAAPVTHTTAAPPPPAASQVAHSALQSNPLRPSDDMLDSCWTHCLTALSAHQERQELAQQRQEEEGEEGDEKPAEWVACSCAASLLSSRFSWLIGAIWGVS
jgi:hypothetical protein